MNPTKQEIFDMVVNGLRKQNAKCIDDNGCKYRVFQGSGTPLKCAVGLLITDEVYDENNNYEDDGSFRYNYLEDNNIEAAEVMDAVEKSLEITDPDWWELSNDFGMHTLLMRLQTVHDSHEVFAWERMWAGIARDFGLTFEQRRAA